MLGINRIVVANIPIFPRLLTNIPIFPRLLTNIARFQPSFQRSFATTAEFKLSAKEVQSYDFYLQAIEQWYVHLS
jgi:hypothetical protein